MMFGGNLFAFLQSGSGAVRPGSREDGYLFDYQDYGIPGPTDPLATEKQVWGLKGFGTPPIGSAIMSPVGPLGPLGPLAGAAVTSGASAAGNTVGGIFVRGTLVVFGIVLIIGAFMLWGRTGSDPVAKAGRKLASDF
jgi:hypothetical protein